MREIELKAHVDDPALLKGLLETTLGMLFQEETKIDVYFGTPCGTQLEQIAASDRAAFRVRIDGGKATVTRKVKQAIEDGTEENREIEFSCDAGNAADLTAFFNSLGYCEIARKEKRGLIWPASYPGEMTVELLEVGSLGWFIEMEIMLEDDCDQAEADRARSALFSFYDSLGLQRKHLERRYYLDLLYPVG
jgi:predicted adenylyl cyclase CyaB